MNELIRLQANLGMPHCFQLPPGICYRPFEKKLQIRAWVAMNRPFMGILGHENGILHKSKRRLTPCSNSTLRFRWVCRQILAFALSFSGLLALLLFPSRVFAHAVLLHSTPKAHEALASGELHVELQFNSRIDAARSSLTLLMPDGQIQKLAQLPQPSPAGLAAKTLRLAPGSYVLRWQVLANDGHITRGEVPFEVK